MNTLNFTFNFNAPVGQNIAHVDKLDAHFDKDMTMQVVDTAAMEASPLPSPTGERENDSSRPSGSGAVSVYIKRKGLLLLDVDKDVELVELCLLEGCGSVDHDVAA